jgi:tetratricopeptide (TPR) repeat protein
MSRRTILLSTFLLASLCGQHALANGKDCPVKRAGEVLLEQGSHYLLPGSGNPKQFPDPLMFKPAYDEILNRKFHVPKPNDYYPVTCDFQVKEIDYLVDPIRNAQELLQAERQASQHEKIGATVHAKRIRERIAEAILNIYGRWITPAQQECLSVAEKLKEAAWRTESAGDLALAEKQYRAIIAIYQEELPNTSLVGNAQSDLARVCVVLNKRGEAKKLYEQAILLYDKEHHVDTEVIATIERYADLIQRDDPAKAEKLFATVSAIRRKLYEIPPPSEPPADEKSVFVVPTFPIVTEPILGPHRPWLEKHIALPTTDEDPFIPHADP